MFKFLNVNHRVTLAGLGLLAVTAVTVGSVAACGSSGPPSATGILSSDGYTTGTQNLSQAQINSEFGSAAPQVTSAAGAENSSGNLEVVVVFGQNGGQSELQTVAPELNTILQGTGLQASVYGDILKVDGSASAFENSSL